jgi:predicted ATPase
MLVARADSLAKLEESLAKAASGRGNVVLLRGEAGIGKSTLLAEAVRRAKASSGRSTLQAVQRFTSGPRRGG